MAQQKKNPADTGYDPSIYDQPPVGDIVRTRTPLSAEDEIAFREWYAAQAKKAGIDPTQPPKTWDELEADAKKLKAAGMCGYSSGWQSWIQLENYSAWHGLPFASNSTLALWQIQRFVWPMRIRCSLSSGSPAMAIFQSRLSPGRSSGWTRFR